MCTLYPYEKNGNRVDPLQKKKKKSKSYTALAHNYDLVMNRHKFGRHRNSKSFH